MNMVTNAMKINKLKRMMRVLGETEALQHKCKSKNTPCKVIKIHMMA